MHFTVSCSSLLRKLLLSNSTNGCCIIRLDQQVVFLEKFRCPDTKKFLLRENNTQKTFYWEKHFSLCCEFNASCGLKGHKGNKIIEISDIQFCQTSNMCVCVFVIDWSALPTEHYAGDQITKKKMSGKCNNMYAGRERCLQAVVERHEGKRELKYLGVDGSTILKWIFMKRNEVWAGLIWLRTGTCGGLLWMR